MPELELRKAHKQDINDLAPKALAEIPSEGFIPFVCHYDPNTIITKNGELMQVIRIIGFHHESVSSELVNLRETVRDAITKHIKTSDFALWLHTIRRKKNIAPKGEYNDYFSAQLNDAWEKGNKWREQYVNELYLTIIIQGYDTSITNFYSLLRSFSLKSTRDLHEKELAKSHKTLTNTVGKVLGELGSYGAKLLGITEWQGTLYSEPLRFFGKLVNLAEERYPIMPTDMSDELLGRHRLAFGNNSLQVVSEKSKNFSSMLSIKEYQEISASALDKFLQLPQEFIITQSIDFINRNKALAVFDYQNYILDISGDEQMKFLTGIETIISSDSGAVNDYGEQQITIMLINETTAGLHRDIDTALNTLHSLGLVTIREDVFSEHCFWSQLPGNFSFMSRQKPINTSHVGGFASLYNFPAGAREGNHWGNAVSIFRTILGTPYFFNFHTGDNGHSMIIGPYGSGKTVLLNFMVSQSRKFNNKLYYFGYNRSANIFINALHGNYYSVTNKADDPNALKLNPLLMEDNADNKKFISDWFSYLVHYGQDPVGETELALIPGIVEKIMASKTKKLAAAAEFFNKGDTPNIYNKLLPWHSGGKYAFIFDHESEIDWSNNLVNASNLTMILQYKTLVIPIISYLLYRVEKALDGNPTMIVIDEAWKYLDNYATGPKINDWLLRMRQKNCMVIFATESVKDASESKITDAIHRNVATHIFLPDPEPTEYYKTVFGLNEEEFQLLSAMSKDQHHFLFKHDEDSVIAALDLSAMPNLMAVLSSKPETILLMEEIMAEYGDDPKNWLPPFYEVAEELRNGGEKIEEEDNK